MDENRNERRSCCSDAVIAKTVTVSVEEIGAAADLPIAGPPLAVAHVPRPDWRATIGAAGVKNSRLPRHPRVPAWRRFPEVRG